MRRLLSALLCAPALTCAHQVPNITAEALFRTSGDYLLKISLDPRVFLSDQPTTLPPVPAEWFTSQTEPEVTRTWQLAKAYLDESFQLHFGDIHPPLPEPAFQPMDGATNEPLSPDTAEVHILATLEGEVPESKEDSLPFVLGFGQDANTSLILLNSVDDKLERRPQVLFPGETSRPFPIPVLAATTSTEAEEEPTQAKPTSAPEESTLSISEREKQHEEFIARSRWWVLASAVLLGWILKRILFPKEKK